MSAKSRGAAREWKVRRELEATGWLVKGSGDSHGAVDLIAVKAGYVRLIQVKGSKAGPFEHFRPEERAAFLEECGRAIGPSPSISVWLAWAPPDRQPTRWLRPDEWP